MAHIFANPSPNRVSFIEYLDIPYMSNAFIRVAVLVNKYEVEFTSGDLKRHSWSDFEKKTIS